VWIDYTPGAVYGRLNDSLRWQDGAVHGRGLFWRKLPGGGQPAV